MKKTKILLGAISLTAIAPMIPTALTSCAQNDKSFTLSITKDVNVVKAEASATELNRAFSVSCVFTDGYEINPSSTKVTIGNKELKNDVDYIIYYNVIIVGSSAVVDKNVSINIVSKPVDVATYTVALYANDGEFTGGKKVLFLTSVKKDTKIKDISGYAEPTIKDLTFVFWRDSNGNKIDPETKVTDNMVLGANYKEVAGTPTNFKTDNWATVAVACESAVKFATAYLNYKGSDEEEAKGIIKTQISTDALIVKEQKASKVLTKEMKLASGAFNTSVSVRLIDVGYDKAVDSSKTIFTWEFADIIDIAMYNYYGSSAWYEENEQGEVVTSCILRENCNKALLQILPVSVQESIKTVEKTTIKKYDDGGTTKETTITSKELLFPLAYQECGLGYAGEKTTPYTIHDFKDDPDVIKTYTHYKALDGQERSKYSTKYYYGYDGTKQYGEGEEYTPIIQYPMWLRSPAGLLQVFDYNPDNQKIYYNYSNSGLGVAPAFCL